jgi:hypothetical protein
MPSGSSRRSSNLKKEQQVKRFEISVRGGKYRLHIETVTARTWREATRKVQKQMKLPHRGTFCMSILSERAA